MIAAVLGANGFLGRNICKKCLEKGNDVVAVYHSKENSIPAACTKYALNDLPAISVDCLYVSIGSHAASHKEFLEQYDLLQKVMATTAFKKIVFISSIAVYGNHGDTIKTDSCYNNPSVYGLSKLSQEFLVRSCKSFAIIRPTYLYGSGMSTNSFIPKIVSSALTKKEIMLLGNGARQQDYLHVSDVTELCYALSLAEENLTVIAASGTSFSNKDVAAHISRLVSGTKIHFQGEDKSPSFMFDISDTKSKICWQPQVSFKEGIAEYISGCAL